MFYIYVCIGKHVCIGRKMVIISGPRSTAVWRQEKDEAGIRDGEWEWRQVGKLHVVTACCLAGSEGQGIG